jgi:KipI family sensor histidine kinase inhibitor
MTDGTDIPPPQIAPLGLDGLLVRFADRLSEAGNRATLAFRAAAEEALEDLLEASSSAGAVHLRFDPSRTTHAELQRAVEELLAQRDWQDAPLPARRRLWRVPAAYGGSLAPQFGRAAALAGMTEEEAIAYLGSVRLRVMAIGFAPGQPYLGHLGERWDLPRQTDLDTRVPPGALGLAVRQMVLFPTASQTGWYHVAQTAFRCFRPDGAPAFPLRPGDEMTFPPVPAEEIEALRQDPALDGGASCEDLP